LKIYGGERRRYGGAGRNSLKTKGGPKASDVQFKYKNK